MQDNGIQLWLWLTLKLNLSFLSVLLPPTQVADDEVQTIVRQHAWRWHNHL